MGILSAWFIGIFIWWEGIDNLDLRLNFGVFFNYYFWLVALGLSRGFVLIGLFWIIGDALLALICFLCWFGTFKCLVIVLKFKFIEFINQTVWKLPDWGISCENWGIMKHYLWGNRFIDWILRSLFLWRILGPLLLDRCGNHYFLFTFFFIVFLFMILFECQIFWLENLSSLLVFLDFLFFSQFPLFLCPYL